MAQTSSDTQSKGWLPIDEAEQSNAGHSRVSFNSVLSSRSVGSSQFSTISQNEQEVKRWLQKWMSAVMLLKSLQEQYGMDHKEVKRHLIKVLRMKDVLRSRIEKENYILSPLANAPDVDATGVIINLPDPDTSTQDSETSSDSSSDSNADNGGVMAGAFKMFQKPVAAKKTPLPGAGRVSKKYATTSVSTADVASKKKYSSGKQPANNNIVAAPPAIATLLKTISSLMKAASSYGLDVSTMGCCSLD